MADTTTALAALDAAIALVEGIPTAPTDADRDTVLLAMNGNTETTGLWVHVMGEARDAMSDIPAFVGQAPEAGGPNGFFDNWYAEQLPNVIRLAEWEGRAPTQSALEDYRDQLLYSLQVLRGRVELQDSGAIFGGVGS